MKDEKEKKKGKYKWEKKVVGQIPTLFGLKK